MDNVHTKMAKFENISLSMFCPYNVGSSHEVCLLKCVEVSKSAKNSL